jgi:hypothetical protein
VARVVRYWTKVDKVAINIVPLFKIVPVVQGVQGWDNRQFSNLWSIKIAAKRLANIFIPSLWIWLSQPTHYIFAFAILFQLLL